MKLKKQTLVVDKVKTKREGQFPVGMWYTRYFASGFVLSRYVWMNYAARPKKGDVIEGFSKVTFKTNAAGYEWVKDMEF